MSLKELKKRFLVQKEHPNAKDIESRKYHSAIQVTIKKAQYWVIFKTKEESTLYDYLSSPKSYKTKEKLFGIMIDEGYATLGEIPKFAQIVLPKKWILDDDGKNKRELTVVITGGNDHNRQLLHQLYTNTRNI